MPNPARYSGICEACDHYQDCKLKRISELEVIECEHFCTHSLVDQTPSAPAENPGSDALEAGGVKP